MQAEGTKTYTEVIAKIERTTLGYEDHGILTCMLHVSYGGSAQGVGGYALDEPRRDGEGEFIGRYGTAFGMEFVRRTMSACGVDEWSKVTGRTIMVLKDGDAWNARVEGIAPLPTEPGERFVFEELAAEFQLSAGV